VKPVKQFDLVGKGNKLIFKDNILAVLADAPLDVVSSAFHKGGVQKTKVIINAQVPQDYNDHNLHQDPELFIHQCFNRLALEGCSDGFVGMVTFAAVEAFSLVSVCRDDLGVTAVVTGGCTHAESAGERTQPQPAAGTINIIVLVDGNPTEAAMVSCIITATEAKSAALRELDVRSLYTGNQATGTPTDATVVAKTGCGADVVYGGPASKLGQLIACCVKQAVKEAVGKAPIGGYPVNRSIETRLAERHLSVEKLASELAKVKCLGKDQTTIDAELHDLLSSNQVFATAVFAAVELSREFEEGRFLSQAGETAALGKRFGELLSNKTTTAKISSAKDCDIAELPVFLKHALIALLKNGF
jgi:adenosylcobinamide hydrolase